MTSMHTNAPIGTNAQSVLAWIRGAIATRAERRRLAELDDSRLADLGLNYRQARREARKPVWDVPSHWLK